ncbi:MAG: hypothetical protein GQE15_07465 [Archangiaceae bacterium]|nr:hypothetical protein [Archangiaceae bacterium]
MSLTPAQAKKIRKLFWMGPDTRTVTVEDIAYAGLDEERELARKAGREEGLSVLRSVLRDLWKARFGKVPKTVQSRFATAEAKQLKQWASRLVTAKSPADVLR